MNAKKRSINDLNATHLNKFWCVYVCGPRVIQGSLQAYEFAVHVL